MEKIILDEKYLKRVVSTTQRIEGYERASKKVRDEAKSLREKYGIKVSIKR